MENLKPEEENIIRHIRNLFRLKKRKKIHCNKRYKKSILTKKRN